MLNIQHNYSLRNNNTFGVNIACSYYTAPSTVTELEYALRYASERNWKYYIIGEGSNLLFTSNFNGLIIHPQMKGIEKVDDSESEILLRVGAGENWDDFVDYCVNNQWFGTENLSLIPGSVGAAPVQNIGAYGVEAKDIIEYVEVFDINKMEPYILSNSACEFNYRDSLFKRGKSCRYIVTHVIFSLEKNGILKLEYGNVSEVFNQAKNKNLAALRRAIISIRESKLPNPRDFCNAGSFFKNPLIQKAQFEQLLKEYKQIPAFPASNDKVKVPAAWLIENAGWKGIRDGHVGSWPKQPLVIVNYKNASGKEIFNFAEKIKNDVSEKFGITLEREVTLIG